VSAWASRNPCDSLKLLGIEQIIPRAIDFFTGKALEYEGEDDFDEDDFEDDDEFDEEDVSSSCAIQVRCTIIDELFLYGTG
jgi:hypothetical protein